MTVGDDEEQMKNLLSNILHVRFYDQRIFNKGKKRDLKYYFVIKCIRCCRIRQSRQFITQVISKIDFCTL